MSWMGHPLFVLLPQGLKPVAFWGLYGTTKVVPFHKTARIRKTLEPGGGLLTVRISPGSPFSCRSKSRQHPTQLASNGGSPRCVGTQDRFTQLPVGGAIVLGESERFRCEPPAKGSSLLSTQSQYSRLAAAFCGGIRGTQEASGLATT